MLFIDDIRVKKGWINLRSSDAAIRYMDKVGCPNTISFDHDLGGDDTAMRVVNYMIKKDIDYKGKFIPNDFIFYVHSANPVGAENIKQKLSKYLSIREQFLGSSMVE